MSELVSDKVTYRAVWGQLNLASIFFSLFQADLHQCLVPQEADEEVEFGFFFKLNLSLCHILIQPVGRVLSLCAS